MNLETKITIYKFTPQVFTLTLFPAILSALTILATVLNFTAHFSNGEYLSWKAFNRI